MNVLQQVLAQMSAQQQQWAGGGGSMTSFSANGLNAGKNGGGSQSKRSINYIEPRIKYGQVVEARWNKYEWPMLLVYLIILVLFIGASIMICVCCCEKEPEEKEEDEMSNKMMNNDEMMPIMNE